jgi:hypothetical protein
MPLRHVIGVGSRVGARRRGSLHVYLPSGYITSDEQVDIFSSDRNLHS